MKLELRVTIETFRPAYHKLSSGVAGNTPSLQSLSVKSFAYCFKYYRLALIGCLEYAVGVKRAQSAPEVREFDPNAFLATIGEGRRLVVVSRRKRVYGQGDVADSLFYIQKGKIRLTVVSKAGRGATIGILGEGDFFGEGALAGQVRRMGSASAMTDCQLMRIEKKAMMDALHREHSFSDRFVAYLLARNIRYEEDLVDHLFNSSEKRLARVLLLLARFGKDGVPEKVVAKISQETLAEMVGTTRSRVSFFMNRFRKMGFIEYNGSLEVHSSLLNVVLHDVNPANETR